jgi:glycosyltransferase involved in cell wall biosynthesis
VPNGFDPDEVDNFSPQLSHQQTNHSKTPRFLYLGRLDMHHKGLDLLIGALAAGIRERKLPPTIGVDFVGADWGDQSRLKGIASQLGIAQNVTFVGHIPDRSPLAIIASYDVLVLPSRFDGFGLVALEAMIASRPILISEEAGISSYVKHAECGYLVKPNVDSIREGLIRAVRTRDQWMRLGLRGRQFAYEHLTWDKSAQQASREYEKLLQV